jgi:hypothetical protein
MEINQKLLFFFSYPCVRSFGLSWADELLTQNMQHCVFFYVLFLLFVFDTAAAVAAVAESVA